MLSDLTGPFGPLVSAIVAGIRGYWEDVNANGGVNGYRSNW
jgi:ABC-type branched-subunit amino acid transport system substrate-binding protein